MLKILWKRGKIAPEEQFLLLSTIFYYLMLVSVKTGIRFSLRHKRLFEITEVEITRVDCSMTAQLVITFKITVKESLTARKPFEMRQKAYSKVRTKSVCEFYVSGNFAVHLFRQTAWT